MSKYSVDDEGYITTYVEDDEFIQDITVVEGFYEARDLARQKIQTLITKYQVNLLLLGKLRKKDIK